MICLSRLSVRISIPFAWVLMGFSAFPLWATEAVTLRNPLRADAEQVPLRVEALAAVPAQGAFVVDGAVVPSQWEEVAGEQGPQRVPWILADLAGGSAIEVRHDPSATAPATSATGLRVQRSQAGLELSNGLISVRLSPDAPIAALRHGDGPWRGAGGWLNAADASDYRLEVLAEGPVQITVLQEFTFPDGQYLRQRIRLRPGRDFVEVEERTNYPGAAWWFDPMAGDAAWPAERLLFTQHGGGAGKPINSRIQDTDLRAGQSRMGDIHVFLLPRWSQAMDDGWLAAASDGSLAIGLITVRAGQWRWPHEGRIAVRLSEAADQLRFELPLARDGARMFWLRAAEHAAWDDGSVGRLQSRLAMGELDKLNRHYILDGFPEGSTGGLPNPFDGGNVNPTGVWRQQARNDFRSLEEGRAVSFGDILWAQGAMDPDYYGTPWYGWSVQNPNFWTDVIQRPLTRLARLTEHPRMDSFQRLAALIFKSDLHHSVTLPGGAGQECPGYQNHALGVWKRLVETTAEALNLGTDDEERWPWIAASEDFLVRSSQPEGNRRRMLPHGDTHPTRGGPRHVSTEGHDPKSWTSEEFPGFGAILRNRTGTAQETFVAFKAGSNRGHYHGDQLSLHWAHNAQPLMVDHYASYNPRVGQEHMHNRLSFGTEAMPWAVMDGHERLIAFATATEADVAIAEVASQRLRRMPKLPPEEWDQRWDTQSLGGELRYRRAVVLLKVFDRDCVLLLDSWQAAAGAPDDLTATFNAHVRAADATYADGRVQFDQALTIVRVDPTEADYSRLDWSHSNGGSEEATVGARFSLRAPSGRMLTVLWPGSDIPPLKAIEGGVQIGDVSVRFGTQVDGGSGPAVDIERAGASLLQVADVDLNRSQGTVGLFVPDAGYPFGPIPEWLAEQRLRRPAWAQDLPSLLDPMESW